MKIVAAVFSFLILLFASPAMAVGPVKLALVIDQVDYRGNLSPLRGADTEATMVSESLVAVGFRVTRVSNLTKAGLSTAFRDFRRQVSATPGAIAFIYYTGHGSRDPASDANDNYLLGVDADLMVASDLPEFGVQLSELNAQFSATGAKAVIMVIDACRTTPTFGKAGSKGLVPVTASTNTLIAYATDTGDVADVGVYAPVLAQELRRPGQDITQVFNAVQILVSQKTNRKQRPWSNNRLYERICLIQCDSLAGPIAGPVPLPTPPQPLPDTDIVVVKLSEIAGVSLWADNYPDRARRMEVEGKTVADCTVTATGTLTDCVIIEETPPDHSFGRATIRVLTTQSKVSLQKFRPGQRLRFPVGWKLSNATPPPVDQ